MFRKRPLRWRLNTTTMSQTVTGKMLSDLPILARNPFSLVLLDPAVVNRYWDVSHRNPFYMQAANGVEVGGNTGGRNDVLLTAFQLASTPRILCTLHGCGTGSVDPAEQRGR